jgi:hypothetical protein
VKLCACLCAWLAIETISTANTRVQLGWYGVCAVVSAWHQYVQV